MSDVAVIANPSEYTRLTARGLSARGDAAPVEREGGKFGAGLIRGASIVTTGEALGHGFWIDSTMLQQVADAINASGDGGLKSRFTHPSMSGDGLGSMLGRAIGPAEVRDGKVIADLHMLSSAHNTPRGDLAGYVMDLAEEAPEGFGTSIVFKHDTLAEREHFDANMGDVVTGYDAKGKPKTVKAFRSPDPNNANHYPHARLKTLRAVDAVDSPAANPDGLFSRGQEIPAEADALMCYAFGLTSDRPNVSVLGVDPDRVREFAARFLESRNLSLKEASMSKEVATAPVETEAPKTEAAPAAPVERTFTAGELGRYIAEFGSENGAKWCTEGKSFEACYAEQAAQLKADLKAAGERATKAEKALGEVKLGEAPVSAGSGESKLTALPIRVRE